MISILTRNLRQACVIAIACNVFFLPLTASAEDAAGEQSKIYAAEIAEVERRGRQVFEKDRAAWVATDHFRANSDFNADGALLGWVTEDVGDGVIIVSFLAFEEDEIVVRHSVDVKNGKVRRRTAQTSIPGRAMSNQQRLMFNARSIALSSNFDACTESYNTVVLPHDGTTFYVYLMPALSSMNVLPFGGHHRFLVDGEIDPSTSAQDNILEKRSFTTSCLNMPVERDAVGLLVTHVTAPYPEEPHIFLNLLREIDIFVVTAKNEAVWLVKDGIVEETELD